MNNAAFELLIASLGAGLCWTLWFYFVKEYRVEAFRERLFSIRDELFLFAADGNVAFDNPAYTDLRDLINGMLRFAHRISFLTLLTFARCSSPVAEGANPYLRWKELLLTLDPSVRERLEHTHRGLVTAYMKQLVEGSVVVFPMAMMLFAGLYVRAHLKRFFSPKETGSADVKTVMLNDLARTLNTQVLEAEAYREGKLRDSPELSLA
jgi:hypothetical protein